MQSAESPTSDVETRSAEIRPRQIMEHKVTQSFVYSISVTSSKSKVLHHVLPRQFNLRHSFDNYCYPTFGPFFNVISLDSTRSTSSFLPVNTTIHILQLKYQGCITNATNIYLINLYF